MEPVASVLSVSKVGPAVDTTTAHVSELVSLMRSGGAGLTDTQSQRLVAYLGNLEDMRGEIGVMVQRYEEDEDITGKLTLLIDRIDESLSIAQKSAEGFTKEELNEAEQEEADVLRESIANGQALLVSTTNFLGISGMLLPRLFAELTQQIPEEEEEEPNGDDFWDPPLSEADMASLDITSSSSTIVPQSLSASVIMDAGELDGAGLPPTPPPVWRRGLISTHEDQIPAPSSSSSSSSTTPSSSSSSSSVAPPSSSSSSSSAPTPADSSSLSSSSSASSSKGKGKRKIPVQGTCPSILCKICYEEYSDWKDLYQLANCEHIYCHDCINEYLTVQITSGGVLDLCCPHPECQAEVEVSDIEAVCSAEIQDKYGKFVIIASLRADPNVRWCPMPQCSASIQGPPKDGSEWVTCGTCSLQVCFACGNERHDPVKCGKKALELIAKRRNAMMEAEQSFEEWHQGKPSAVKPCPKCKAYIEKNQGCNHMTCASCKFQFCWLCLAKYVGAHYNDDAFPDCKGKQYWTPPLPPSPPDPELQARYNWIYYPPNYQYAGVDAGPLHEGREPLRRERRRPVTAKKVAMYIGGTLAVATLGIPVAVIGGPIYGVFKLHQTIKRRNRRR